MEAFSGDPPPSDPLCIGGWPYSTNALEVWPVATEDDEKNKGTLPIRLRLAKDEVGFDGNDRVFRQNVAPMGFSHLGIGIVG